MSACVRSALRFAWLPAVVAAAPAFAQPAVIPVQGTLSDPTGVPMPGPVELTFEFYADPRGGAPLYTERLAEVPLASGRFTVELGSQAPLPMDLFRTYPTLFVEVVVDAEPLPDRIRLGLAPYAAVSEFANMCRMAEDIQDAAVTEAKISSGAVTADKIAERAISSDKIAGSAISTELLADASVTDAKLAPGAVSVSALADGIISADKIADGSVTEAKLASDAVTTAKIAPGEVGTINLANGAVTTDKIRDGQVGTADLADGAVREWNLAPNSVGTSQLATSAVLSANIRDGTIRREDIDATTTLRASDFEYSTARTRIAFADPTNCHRTSGAVGESVRSTSPPANAFGPSLQLEQTLPAGTYSFYCALDIPRTNGVITLTGGDIAFYDASSSCIVNVELRTKRWGSLNFGTIRGTARSGASLTDFAATPRLATASFQATSAIVRDTDIVFLVASIRTNAVPHGDCRYSGARITYTTTAP